MDLDNLDRKDLIEQYVIHKLKELGFINDAKEDPMSSGLSAMASILGLPKNKTDKDEAIETASKEAQSMGMHELKNAILEMQGKNPKPEEVIKKSTQLSIQKLGRVQNAELKLNDLTIIAGGNSSGKSYVVYSLWKSINSYNKSEISNIDDMENILQNILQRLQNIGWNSNNTGVYQSFSKLSDSNQTIELSEADLRTLIQTIVKITMKTKYQLSDLELQQLFQDKSITGTVILKTMGEDQEIIESMIEDFKQSKHQYYQPEQLSPDEQKSGKVDRPYKISIHQLLEDVQNNNSENEMLNHIRAKVSTEVFANFMDYLSNSQKTEGTSQSQIETTNKLHAFVGGFYKLLLQHVFFQTLPYRNSQEASLITSERSGAFLFWHEESDKSDQSRLGHFSNDNQSNDRQYNASQGIYSEPVSENLKFVRNLALKTRDRSHIATYNPEIITQLEMLMGGKLSHSFEGVKFQPFEMENTDSKHKQPIDALPFHLLSASVRSLSYLYFYLKHQIQQGEILIIDEPESYLHPSNQMKMARIIAMLVNAGVKVVITTHSDYMIREFNALIALGSMSTLPTEEQKSKYTVFDEINNDMMIRFDKVNLYGLTGGYLSEKLTVNENGLNLYTFNEAREQQEKLFTATNNFLYYDRNKNKGS